MKITTAEFESKVLQSSEPIIVDFYADWCGPCKMQSPILDEISEATVYKVNIDEEPDLATRYSVMSIPTLIVFKNGEVASKSVGLTAKEQILEMLK